MRTIVVSRSSERRAYSDGVSRYDKPSEKTEAASECLTSSDGLYIDSWHEWNRDFWKLLKTTGDFWRLS